MTYATERDEHEDWIELLRRLREEITLLSELARDVECFVSEQLVSAAPDAESIRGLQGLDLLIQSTDALSLFLERLVKARAKPDGDGLSYAVAEITLGAMVSRLRHGIERSYGSVVGEDTILF